MTLETFTRPPSLGAYLIGEGANQRVQVMYDMPLGYPRRFVLVPVQVDETAPLKDQVRHVLPAGGAPEVPGLERGCYVNRVNLSPKGAYVENVSPEQWPMGGNHVLMLLHYDQHTPDPDPVAVVDSARALLADEEHGGFAKLRTGLLPQQAAAAAPATASRSAAKNPTDSSPAEAPPLRFVLASCQYPHDVLDRTPDPTAEGGYEPGPPDLSMMELARVFKGRRAWPERDPEAPSVLVLCGDQVYVDATAGLFDPTTLYDRFRRPYTLIRQSRGGIELQRYQPARVHRLIDDHEIDDGWAPGDNEKQAEYGRLGAEAYFELQRAHAIGELGPNDPLPQADEETLYGDTDFFFGDTRLHREVRTAADYKTKSILGVAQEERLHSWLRQPPKSASAARVVATPAMLLPRPLAVLADAHAALHCDSWCGYPKSLHALLALIARQRLAGLVFVSGDEHLSGVATITLYQGTELRATLWSIHSSPMYAPYPFANGDAAELAETDAFEVHHPLDGAVAFTCRVEFELAPPGDGFAVVTMAADASTGRPFSVQWHRPADASLKGLALGQRIKLGNHNASG